MVIFFYGDDSYRSHQKLVEIKNKYLQSDKSGSGLSSFDFSEKSKSRDVINIFSLPNLLAPKRLVIIKRMISHAAGEEIDEMLAYLEKHQKSILEDQDLVVVFWEENMPKKNGKLFKFLEKNTKKQNFEKITGMKINQWIVKRVTELDPGCSISQRALEKLVSYSGGDNHVIENELEKLTSYKAGAMIEERDVEDLVKANIDANIFNTIDALANNNKKTALKLIHDHLEKGEDAFYLFSMFVYQFRNLLKVADIRERNIFSEYEIAKITKLHPFVVKKSLAQIRNFPMDKLKTIYQELANIDRKMKTGKLEAKLALDKFITEI